MNEQQYQSFDTFRKEFRTYCSSWADYTEELSALQILAAQADGVPSYPIENPVVYNTALDSVGPDSSIKLIVIGDNPGKTEQLTAKQQYLVGQAGKIAEGFFRKNPALNIDFRQNVIILNKTPVHSAKTKELSFIVKHASRRLAEKIQESVVFTAKLTARLHAELSSESPCMMWMVGYGELKSAGIFAEYVPALKTVYEYSAPEAADSIMVYQHFSMNRFSIDLNDNFDTSLSLSENLAMLGRRHRLEILGF